MITIEEIETRLSDLERMQESFIRFIHLQQEVNKAAEETIKEILTLSTALAKR